MSEIDPKIIEAVPPHWLMLRFVAVGGWIAKMIIGRHLKTLDTIAKVAQDTNEVVKLLDARVSRLEGRFLERDHNGWIPDRT